MIKPHGSDTLNPLFVSDDAERAKFKSGVTELADLNM